MPGAQSVELRRLALAFRMEWGVVLDGKNYLNLLTRVTVYINISVLKQTTEGQQR